MRGGVHPAFQKEQSANWPIRRLEIPPQLIIPLQQHIGDDPRLIVATGDKVLKGQPLTSLGPNHRGAIVHAPTSGVVSEVKDHPLPHPSGLSGPCVFIETDGQDQWIDALLQQASIKDKPTETLDQPACEAAKTLSKQEMLNRIESAGVVGLGGATFPSAVKLAAAGQQRINTLIINAAECEPYITCDDRLIRECADEIVKGVAVLASLLQIKQCIIGIEDNKAEAIDALNLALNNQSENECSIGVGVIPTQYPSGDARQLTRILTGIEIPKNTHSLASGVLCHNIATAYAVYEAVALNKPLLSRTVTITGDGVAQPQNVNALIGTPISYIIEQIGYTEKAERMIMGGPMMGFALPSDELPIVKASNCILVSSKAELALASHRPPNNEKQVMPCIRCNKCADACPVNLLPQQLYWHSRAHDFDKVIEHNLSDCIECGACSYVCPSYIPLVDYFRFAKTEIKSQQQAALKSSKARERFEFNEQRKIRIKAERDAKRRAHKEALMKKKAAEQAEESTGKSTSDDAPKADKSSKQDAIKAAMERAKAKKAAMKAAEKKDNTPDAV